MLLACEEMGVGGNYIVIPAGFSATPIPGASLAIAEFRGLVSGHKDSISALLMTEAEFDLGSVGPRAVLQPGELNFGLSFLQPPVDPEQ